MITGKMRYASGMNQLAEVFRSEAGIPKRRLEIYSEALTSEGVTLRQFEFAVKRLIQTRASPFFPVPREIIDVARLCPRLTLAGDAGKRRLLPSEPVSLEKRRADKERLRELRANLEALDKQNGTHLAEKVCGS